MALQQAQSICPYCQQSRLFTKRGTAHMAHFLVSFFLLGLWVPVWVLAALRNRGQPYRCTVCGSPPPLTEEIRV